jgi:hypothetical protein
MFGKRRTADDTGIEVEPEVAEAEPEVVMETAPKARITGLRLDGRSVLHAGKRKIAINLLWQQRRESADIRTQANETGGMAQEYDRYVLFADNRQIGLASGADGVTPGMLVGATMFDLAVMGRTWFGAFQVGPQSWWIVAYKEGMIYTDALLHDESDARLHLQDIQQWANVSTRIAPADWHVPNAEDKTLLDVLAKKGVALKPTSFIKAYGSRILIGVLVLMMLGGAYYAMSFFQSMHAAQQAEIQAAAAARARASIPRVAPYDKMPSPARFLDVCEQEFEKLIMPAPGWDQGPLICDATPGKVAISTGWMRNGGRFQYLLALKPDALPAEVSLDTTGNRATMALSADIPADNLGTAAWTAEQVETKLRQRFQALGLELVLRPSIQRLTTTQQRQLKDPVYNYHEMVVTTSTALTEYVRLIADVPFVVPQALSYDLRQGAWQYTLRIYHPAIMPLPNGS